MVELTLYGIPSSPPCRCAMLTLKALDLTFAFVHVNIFAGEQLAADFLKKNPLHAVPVLEDNGVYITDSHAISAYLVNKYAKTKELYPVEPLQRVVVDQRLFFDNGIAFYAALRPIIRSLLFKKETVLRKDLYEEALLVYTALDTYLQEGDYVAGGNLTIADLSLVSTVSTLELFIEIDAQKYPKLAAWCERMKQLPYYQEANGKGLEEAAPMMKSLKFTIES